MTIDEPPPVEREGDAVGGPSADLATDPEALKASVGAPAAATASPAPLTPTGRVILGMIALGKQTGYDIKQLVDKSTRHFWAASYGQIYPELRRLKEQGLIIGRDEPSGARARTVYELTEAGREALRRWLASDAELVDEMRDEGMLKLFFSDVAPELRLKNLRAMRALYERQHDQLRGVAATEPVLHVGPGLTLQLGLELTAWLAEWCDAAERRLAAAADAEPELEPNAEV